MKVKEKPTRAKGSLTVTAKNIRTGEEKKIYSGKNLIVNGLYENLVYLLGKSAAYSGLDYLRFGTGQDAEDPSQTGLITPVGPNVDLTITYPDTATLLALVGKDDCVGLQCVGTLGSASANGFALAEIGLYTDGTPNVMVARRTFGPFTKSSDWILSVTWILYWELS